MRRQTVAVQRLTLKKMMSLLNPKPGQILTAPLLLLLLMVRGCHQWKEQVMDNGLETGFITVRILEVL
jgi:hypothetical protein